MAQFFVVETIAIAKFDARGYNRRFMACASKAAAEWHCEKQEIARGFDARVLEVTESEYNAVLKGEWNDIVASNKLVW